jgi:hypothetical protein
MMIPAPTRHCHHITVSGWNCSGSDHFPFGDDALGDDHRGGSYHDGGGSESGQRSAVNDRTRKGALADTASHGGPRVWQWW